MLLERTCEQGVLVVCGPGSRDFRAQVEDGRLRLVGFEGGLCLPMCMYMHMQIVIKTRG